MANKVCNNCAFLNIDEHEQNLIKAKLGKCPPHICTKYDKRVTHFPYRHPSICPCEECRKEINNMATDVIIRETAADILNEFRKTINITEVWDLIAELAEEYGLEKVDGAYIVKEN